ncbi:phage holin family protein [Marinomonas atlantica]|uniref:phage holin family protein n=1 Tax=Marinomonas atlantica TaxID=1806668 RepID=UPI0008334C94|nr:phage holin family protein [Marinomonas atlantica]
MKPLLDDLLPIAAFILVGVLGGAVKYLRQIKQKIKDFSIIQLLITVMTGGFLGMLTYFLGTEMGMSGPMIGFMAGMAGLMGDEAISFYTNKFKGMP